VREKGVKKGRISNLSETRSKVYARKMKREKKEEGKKQLKASKQEGVLRGDVRFYFFQGSWLWRKCDSFI
jgi:hypothetical protein